MPAQENTDGETSDTGSSGTPPDAAPGVRFQSIAEALRVGRAVAEYLNSPAADDLDGAARGEALTGLGAIGTLLDAARNQLLRRLDDNYDHDADGYASASAWLAAKTNLGPKDARAAVRQMRLLARHPHLDAATTTGALSVSWAREIAGWTKAIDDEDLQGEADRILVEAAAAGAALDDLKLIAQAAYEAWRAQEPDPEEDPRGKGFPDRDLRLPTTLDGAGRISGDLTPECAAAVTAVLEALGKRQGPEDLRTAGQRYHDALQEACQLLLRARLVPDRAGTDTRVDVIIPLSDLRAMGGAPALEEAWLRAKAGQHGYLTGTDAQTAACDALITPVVTGAPDWDLISQMITLVTTARRHTGPQSQPDPPAPPAPPPLRPEAREALQHALARLAIDFVSGPGALASALRRGLLRPPLTTRSVPIDVGQSKTIPDPIRRAVILRDQHCAWPGGCDRRPAACDVHHIKHKKDGGPTSVKDCLLLCHYHHKICIHRHGWTIELLPDGTTRATSPDGQVIRSHQPPAPPPPMPPAAQPDKPPASPAAPEPEPPA